MTKCFMILGFIVSGVAHSCLYGGVTLALGLGVDYITPQWNLEAYALAISGLVFAYHFIGSMIAAVFGAIMIIGRG